LELAVRHAPAVKEHVGSINFVPQAGKGSTMKIGFAYALIYLASLFAPPPAQAEHGNVERGFIFARQHCSICHAIQKTGESPQKLAPPFRELHLRYPVEELAESLGEGIRTGHPMMPEFQLDPDQIEDFLAYLKSLE
jgi:cytochrome c